MCKTRYMNISPRRCFPVDAGYATGAVETNMCDGKSKICTQ